MRPTVCLEYRPTRASQPASRASIAHPSLLFVCSLSLHTVLDSCNPNRQAALRDSEACMHGDWKLVNALCGTCIVSFKIMTALSGSFPKR